VPTYFALGDPVGPILDGLWSGGAPPPHAAPAPGPTPPHAVPVAKAPDLVLVLIDTLRADSLAVYGGDPALMPRLNALAEKSLVIGSLSANATYTKSSVASMFTGLTAEAHGAVDHEDRLPEERLTLAEVMRGRGYETAAFVANYLNVGRRSGFDQGFDEFVEVEVPGQTYARAQQVNARLEHWLAERASRRGKTRPAFVYLHYLDPHTPYLSGWPDPGRTPSAMRRGYEAELRYTDEQVADAIERLEQALGEDAVIVLVSDHGEEFGEHGAQGHGHALYRELLDVPALVYQRGGPRGRVETRLEGRDVFAMIPFLSRFGAEGLPEWAVARSRESRYASQYNERDRSLHRPDRWFTVMRSLEDGDRQLIWSAYGPTEELYDLRVDPGQLRNLRATQPSEAATLRGKLVDSVDGWASREVEDLSPEAESQLKQLGYLE